MGCHWHCRGRSVNQSAQGPVEPINPGFEEGLTGWSPDPAPVSGVVASVWEIETDSGLVYAGQSSLKWTGDTTDADGGGAVAYVLFYKDQEIGIPPNPGGTPYVGIRMRVRAMRDGGPDGFSTAGIGLASFTSAGVRVSEKRDTSVVLVGDQADSGWQYVSVSFQADAEAAYYKVFVHAQARAGRTMLFDSLEWDAVEPGAPPPPTPTPTPPPLPKPTPPPSTPAQGSPATPLRSSTATNIPRPDEPVVDSRGLITRSWRNYLTSLAVGGDLGLLWAAIEELRQESGPGGGLPADTRVYGEQSVESFGTLADGLVRLTLVNDQAAPAPSSYYGTDDTGARGFHLIPEPPSSGFIPMTTGEIVDGQPVFLYGPDGRLIYGPAN